MIKRLIYGKNKRSLGLGDISYRYSYRAINNKLVLKLDNPLFYEKATLSTSISFKLSRISRKINSILLSNYHSYK